MGVTEFIFYLQPPKAKTKDVVRRLICYYGNLTIAIVQPYNLPSFSF